MRKTRIKLDAETLADRLKCTIRHARRLRAEDDDRCYVDVREAGAQGFSDPADATMELRRIMGLYTPAMLAVFALSNDPQRLKNPPVHLAEIVDALTNVSHAIRQAERLIGCYYDDEPDGREHHGEVTVYELAQRGAKIHRVYKDELLAWAEKYNQPLSVTFWGYPDGMVETDDKGNEIPPPPEEVVIRSVVSPAIRPER